MLNYDESQNLTNFLGFGNSLGDETATVGTVQRDEPSLLEQYDNFIYNSFSSAEDTISSIDIANETAVNSVKSGFDTIKQTFSELGDGINTGKNVILVTGVLVLGVLTWNFIGRDIYYITKGK